MDKEAGKKRAAEAAASYVERGMTLGLGTGSTAAYFIDLLAAKIAQGWPLRGVPTSEETRLRAERAGVEIVIPDETTIIDLAVDGADEVDPALNLIKGGGGALLREKIVARAARRFVVIADKSKRVAALGAFPLPVEIEPFGWALTVRRIRAVLGDGGFENPGVNLRARAGKPFATDGGHLLVDCALGRIAAPARLEAALIAIPGVMETGLFCGLAHEAVFGDETGVRIERAS
jgi:ribose 5-phosphate isomerase A